MLLNIDVPDLEAASRFYGQAFGWRKERRLGDAAIEMSGAPLAVFLLENAAGTCAHNGEARRYSRHWTPLHCDIAVDDLRAVLERALDAGARREGDIRNEPFGRIVQLADPFGHGWCLIEFNATGYDAIITTHG
ncbi:VOC family protein [Solilutibacter pythonis]